MVDKHKLSAAIALKGETQSDAAKVMGMHPATLHRKICGESDFYREEIAKFCKHYDADPVEIFFAKIST